ncbi:hypothetical protein BGZ61DRAFT_468281 [Ilyonectria robusta]|uniref:uncharacterized protein n=1 Tax=Ilyonectria robusta TaxID=1079257 RepID=UPI001E8D9E7D|nr:uncharacterized protein BGZ61DRAFT_468281 [Ilyonectria robusta]KAH8652937.1 hypothetical protein BGZ61DRAFT_468281 [Ilyonectria robusta]
MRFALPEMDPAMPVPPLALAGSPVALSSAHSLCPHVDRPRNWPKAPQGSSPRIAAILRVHDVSGGLGRGSKSDAQQPVACPRPSQTQPDRDPRQ